MDESIHKMLDQKMQHILRGESDKLTEQQLIYSSPRRAGKSLLNAFLREVARKQAQPTPTVSHTEALAAAVSAAKHANYGIRMVPMETLIRVAIETYLKARDLTRV